MEDKGTREILQKLAGIVADNLARGVGKTEVIDAVCAHTGMPRGQAEAFVGRIDRQVNSPMARKEDFAKFFREGEKIKLHIGCGEVRLPGWINVDQVTDAADVHHDMRHPLPLDAGSVDYIFNEHFLEHLKAADGVALLKEFLRVLKPGGVLRIAVPDLESLVLSYSGDWKSIHGGWMNKYGYGFIRTRAELLNVCFRTWGHEYLYDEEELGRRLAEAGFSRIKRERHRESSREDLRGLETREADQSNLIVEAEK